MPLAYPGADIGEDGAVKISINAVAFHDGGRWIAQGVEYDIAVSTDSINDLMQAFEKAVLANIFVNIELGRQGLDGIPPAPEHFHTMFHGAQNFIGRLDEDDQKNLVHIPSLRLVQIGA